MSLLAIERQAQRARLRRAAMVEPTALRVSLGHHDDEAALAARHDEARAIRLALAQEESAETES